MIEQWRDIRGFKGLYQVSDLGRVRSLPRVTTQRTRWGGVMKCEYPGRVLAAVPGDAGRVQMNLSKGNKRFARRVHRLVLEAFVGSCPRGMEGCHNDGNPQNNALSNLRWDTPIANAADRDRHGRMPRGEHHPTAQFTSIDAERVADLHRAGYGPTAIGAWLGISKTQTARFINRL